MAKKIFLLLLGVVLFTPICGQSSYTHRVAILEIVDKKEQLSYGTKLMIRSNLAEAITATPGYEGYDRVDISSIMSEHDFQRTGMVNDAEIKRLGEMAGSRYILIAEVVKLDGHNLYLATKIIDVESANIEIAINIMCAGVDAADIQSVSKKMAEALLDKRHNVPYPGSHRTVAILDIVDRTDEVNYATKFIVRSNITKIITDTPGYVGYDRVDVSSIMNEHEFQRTGLVSETDIKSLGEMAGAQYILILEIVRVTSETLFLTAKILDVETAKIEKTANVQFGTSYTELEDACASLAKRMLGLKETKSGFIYTDDMNLFLYSNEIYLGGYYEDAIELLEFAREKDDQDYRILKSMGYVYMINLKNFTKAKECYEEAYELYYKKFQKPEKSYVNNILYCEIKEFNQKARDPGFNKDQILNKIKNMKKYINDHPRVIEFIGDLLYYCFINHEIREDEYKDKNAIENFNCFSEAAVQGNSYAQHHLSIFYERGYGTKMNKKQAKYWLQKAAEQGHEKAKKKLKSYK